MTDLTKVEYRVRKVERFIVTRFHEDEGGGAGVDTIGEYSREDGAFDVAYAMCRAEHQRLGWSVGDERIQYPIRPSEVTAEAA